MSKKATTITLEQVFQQYPNMSLRKIAEGLSVNYNMLLKYSKQPIEGVPYDPTVPNLTKVEEYLTKKLGEAYADTDWSAINDISASTRVPKEAYVWKIGDQLTLRQDEHTYMVHMRTDTHIVIMAVDGTQPRVFSFATFLHQGPKKIETVEEAK